MLAVFGGEYFSYAYLAQAVLIFEQPFGLDRIAAFLASIALCLAVVLWLNYTRAGLAFRAVAVNPIAAGLVAIKVARVWCSWASAVVYASLQILEQSIEAVGSKDRQAVTAHIKANTFKTVIGPITFNNYVHDRAKTGTKDLFGSADLRYRAGQAGPYQPDFSFTALAPGRPVELTP